MASSHKCDTALVIFCLHRGHCHRVRHIGTVVNCSTHIGYDEAASAVSCVLVVVPRGICKAKEQMLLLNVLAKKHVVDW
jgi:hypothetical protein